MPLPAPRRQSGPATGPAAATAAAWFETAPGRAVLDSETAACREACQDRPRQRTLCLGPVARPTPDADGRVDLHLAGDGFAGAIRCLLPLPMASESLGTVVVQHAADGPLEVAELLAECTRVLVPGGRLWLFALNPLAPYRWRWQGTGLRGAEPVAWRRRLRTAGLWPDSVTRGLGPRWRPAVDPRVQDGAGLRAAFLLRAEKRRYPLTPVKARALVRLPTGVPAA